MFALLIHMRRLFLVLTISAAAYLPATHAALIDFHAPTADAIVGETVEVDLVVSGLGNFAPESLGAFDVSVNYDATVFGFAGYALGNLLGNLGLVEALDASGGDTGTSVNIAEVSLLSIADLHALQPDAFTLATLTFDVLDLAIGATSQLSLGDPLLAGADGDVVPATSGGPTTFVGRAAVPSVGTALLFLGGLLSMRLARRR